MGTVGLAFGSATSGQGFDVATTVSSIVSIRQGVETAWKDQLTSLQSQDTVLSQIGTDLSTMYSALTSLTDFAGVMAQKQGSSSDNNILSLSSASSTATAGSHSVVVSSLAKTSSMYTSQLSSSATSISGSLTFQVGSGTAQTVNVASGSSLADYAKAINLAGIGVRASVITDSSGSRLSFVSQTSGAAGQLTITGNLSDNNGSALTMNQGQTGSDAQLTVDGVTVTSSSNTVSGAIPGVSFQLVSADPSSTVQVVIANDNSSIETAFNSFVSAYNTVAKELAAQSKVVSGSTAPPLAGTSTLSMLQQALSGALFGGTNTGSVKSIDQLGITVAKDGTLSFDATALESTLTSNFDDVVGFLQNSDSFGQNFKSVVDGLGSTSTKGVVYLAQQENTSKEKALNDSISNEEDRIADFKTRLTSQLTAANQILQSIPAQMDQINKIYSALTGYNTKG
ncbi:flagellar filament capping protein FliD [Terriglobus albidus]|uniref:flagellar filament capping protein FliD n=1 Tax=Terriglobus albidus TaxID=1592106 RepID=UPI0021DFA5BA|nr:flagellar filament capping protein FliD [Terriglobus albidus]